ncbi:MAG: GNAT family acetyltransferase [candidate division Zixibacteria bacterium]|nr:GNAT family acetyltransferase [candidate division Zixibacteria bacterium]
MTNPGFRIRPYQPSDEQSVIALWQACNLVVPWNDPASDIRRKMQVNPELFLVGENDSGLVATVMGGYEGHRGWANYLAVAPSHRRSGYGRIMMEAVEQRLKAMGCPKINLQVRESNAEVIRFYEDIGYKNDRVVSFGKRLIDDPPG